MNLARAHVFLLYRDGVSQVEIARTAGVSKQRINQIVTSFRYEIARRRYLESVEGAAENHRVYQESARMFGANQQAFVESLKHFDDTFEAHRRTVRTVRQDREARRLDRQVRMAYLKAHPRAKRAAAPRRRAPELRLVV